MNQRSRGALVDGLPARQGALARARRRAQRLTVSRAEIEEAQLEAAVAGASRRDAGERRRFHEPHRRRQARRRARLPRARFSPATSSCAPSPSTSAPASGRSPTSCPNAGVRSGASKRYWPTPTGSSRRRSLAHTSRSCPLGCMCSPAADEHGLDPDQCAELLALLSCFYEAIVLDLGAGVIGPSPTLAANRADQIVLVTSPDAMASTVTLHARAHLRHPERTTVAINGAATATPAAKTGRTARSRFRTTTSSRQCWRTARTHLGATSAPPGPRSSGSGWPWPSSWSSACARA